MRAASTPARTEEIIASLSGDKRNAEVVLYYWADNAWNLLEDLDEEAGVQWDQPSTRFDYTSIVLVPQASNIGFTVKNWDGRYSPGSGTQWSGVLDANTKIKLQAGYTLADYGATANLPMNLLEGINGYGFYFKNVGGVLVPDATNTSGDTSKYFHDVYTLYGDGATYGDSYYGPGGYFVSTLVFPTKDYNATKIKVTAQRDHLKVYYKVHIGRDSDAITFNLDQWIYAGETISGTVALDINAIGRIIDVAIFDDGYYGWTPQGVTALSIDYQTKIEWVYNSVFYLDTPEFTDPPAPEIATVICAGRDVFKRAQEHEMNLPDISGLTVDQVIKYVCDEALIPYTSTSIADLSAFGTRTLTTGLENSTTADKILEYCMQLITQYGLPRYQMFILYDPVVDDNVLTVKLKSTSAAPDMIFTQPVVSQIGNKRKNYDRLVTRFSVYSKKESFNNQTLLATQNITAAGDYTISWSGDNYDKNLKVTVNSGSATVTLQAVAIPVTPTSVLIHVAGTAFDIDVKVYGNTFTTTPAAAGENFYLPNMLGGAGKTLFIENLLVNDDAEAQRIAKALTDDCGSPAYEIGDIQFPYLNVMLDQNDTAAVWSKINFIQNFYNILNVKFAWNRAASPQQTTGYALVDNGQLLTSERWDDIVKWDTGWLWDMQFGPRATSDNTDYNYLKPVEFT
jgi:hypothetical protein